VRPVREGLPAGVNAQKRTDGKAETVFVMNFNNREAGGLPPYGLRVEK
jgi:hypothetical protein